VGLTAGSWCFSWSWVAILVAETGSSYCLLECKIIAQAEEIRYTLSSMSIAMQITWAVLLPFVLVLIVGLPAWLAARVYGSYAGLRQEYYEAVGIEPPKRMVEISDQAVKLPQWMLIWVGFICIKGMIRAWYPALGFTAYVLMFAGLGFWSAHHAFSCYGKLLESVGVEARLRWFPRIQVGGWIIASVSCFTFVHLLLLAR
jgi:hypothetical protein